MSQPVQPPEPRESICTSSRKMLPISRLDKALNPHPLTVRCHYEMTFGSAIENIRYGIYFKREIEK